MWIKTPSSAPSAGSYSLETWMNTLLALKLAVTVLEIRGEKPPDSRVLHSPWRYSLQWSCTSTCLLATTAFRSVTTSESVTSVSFFEPVAEPVEGVVSALSMNVTQNRYSRSRHTTGAR